MADMGHWQGLFNWSMSYADGTTPTDFSSIETNPAKLKWLEGVMKQYMVDFADRMTDIKTRLDASTSESSTEEQLAESEKLLEELMEIVESIDFARDLRTIGGLPTLIELMRSKHDSLRWRAAEVCAVCCQNHPEVQTWFLEGGALPVETDLLRAESDMVVLKGLTALSAMLRGHPAALAAFLQDLQGLPLVIAACERNPRICRKALELLKHICHAVPSVRLPMASSKQVPAVITASLTGSDDVLITGSLGLLGELIDDRSALQALREQSALGLAIHGLQERYLSLEGEDRDAVLEEIEQLDNLASAWKDPCVELQ